MIRSRTLSHIAAVTATATLTTLSAGAQNLITNPDFESGSAPWWTFSGGTASHTNEIVDGEMCVTIVEPGTVPWDVLLAVGGLDMAANQEYRLSFVAHGDVPRSVRVRVGLNSGSYTDYFAETVVLTTSPETINLAFLARSRS